MGDLSGSYAMQCEDIIFAVKGRHILNDGRTTDVLKFGCDKLIDTLLEVFPELQKGASTIC